MSRHPEILWAQRSSGTDKEKVGTCPSSVVTCIYSPCSSLTPSQLECPICDSQPSRYRRIISSIRSQTYRTLLQGTGGVCDGTFRSDCPHSFPHFITFRTGEPSTYEFNIDFYKEIIPEVRRLWHTSPRGLRSSALLL